MLDLFGFLIPLLYIHLGTFALLIPLILFADHQGFLWVRGSKETLNAKTVGIVHNLVWVGLIVMIVSGIVMALPVKDYLLATPAFYSKMFFVLLLVINSFFIGKCMHVATERSFASLTPKERAPLLISGAVSGVGWLGAFLSAIFMGFGTVLGFLNSLF